MIFDFDHPREESKGELFRYRVSLNLISSGMKFLLQREFLEELIKFLNFNPLENGIGIVYVHVISWGFCPYKVPLGSQ